MMPSANPSVVNILTNYGEPFTSSLLEVRTLIFKIASTIDGVGELTESLKWGQPTYSTLQTKSGTPIRIDKFDDNYIGIFFHCQTTLLGQFKELFSQELMFSKNRAILLDPSMPLPLKELEFCIAAALVYHKDNIKKDGL